MNNKGLDIEALKESLLDAALLHVVFDGWTLLRSRLHAKTRLLRRISRG